MDKPKKGFRFYHSRILDTQKFDGKSPQLCEVTKIAQEHENSAGIGLLPAGLRLRYTRTTWKSNSVRFVLLSKSYEARGLSRAHNATRRETMTTALAFFDQLNQSSNNADLAVYCDRETVIRILNEMRQDQIQPSHAESSFIRKTWLPVSVTGTPTSDPQEWLDEYSEDIPAIAWDVPTWSEIPRNAP